MQFHHDGYVSGDPRIQPARGTGLHRPSEIPDEVDVLIVGSGPAGMLLAAQLSQYPSVTTRIIERRAGRLKVGQADGIQARSVETFQAFGFAERITQEAHRITSVPLAAARDLACEPCDSVWRPVVTVGRSALHRHSRPAMMETS